LTIDRIYSLLEQCTDEQFLICLLSLLRNLFNEKDTEVLLPMFDSVKLLAVREIDENKNPSIEFICRLYKEWLRKVIPKKFFVNFSY
jgi:hypothetical protein